ncbi:hypothetical protein FA13DRAFT_1757685 [Coprinellus micaceus]|uniref:CxC2-like cysteine cluster KDZ transposase-associated domain-containing protein n=1 Tax=Coprinellus micaceus TaxID=71717 RepID=A0A4Y7SGF6_COPMI|nr:hypothetical protein FA13DRAFT_1757685 [Coprinellus micaceus]
MLRPPSKGELALFCAVCPQPGVNLPPDWKERITSWMFWRYLTGNGNFKKTCVQHQAVKEKNKVKPGYDITGVVSVACARHGCFAPAGTVDLQKGERQINMDLALSEACDATKAGQTLGLRFTYDINCQYCVNFHQKVGPRKPLSIPENMALLFVIGLFHVHGHKEECLALGKLGNLSGAHSTL